MMTKQALTDLILEKKTALGLSWADIASGVDLSPTFVTSACLGMNSLKPEFADKLIAILELPAEAKAAIEACPMKTWEQTVPTDPLIYRLYEVVGVYGSTMKELIHEEFGDGIMSAIDFSLDVDREVNPAGDRVVITMNGKFLPYKSW
ncbi:cyanase [Guyparkeria hydrothermalis]|uniref:cyanase n=1 Tax=Guyparkeria TaxID=2035712 RepID=UPI000F6536D3|nr:MULTISPECIES: cyanase [Guyparkeria]MCL7751396.1 cyanase [Guyparkeria hydrothermalis]RRQ23860.1 cyanase [Guyparkeria sp. SCN-R1]TKA91876.1 cyanase [Guyparkeria sp. SB14A]